MIKVITYGTYDLLHYGHIRLLERAKELGDYLIVGITADDFDKYRGKINVEQSLMERIEAIKACGIADEIIIEEYEGQKIDDINRYDVDIFAVGSDWKGQFDYLNSYCKVVYLDRTEGISSSDLRKQVRNTRLGLVGETPVVQKYFDESSHVNGFDITSIYSANLEILKMFEGREVELTSDFNSFLELVDAVYIVSHPKEHYNHAKQALLAGKHVLCQSPITLTKIEYQELFSIAEKNNLILMEGIKTAFSTAYHRLCLLAKGGTIGQIVSVDVACTRLENMNVLEIKNMWDSMSVWGSTAMLPIFQLLGTDFLYKNIHSLYFDEEQNFDIFTKIDFTYSNAVASLKIGSGVKTEGELIITGTKGYIYVPAPWWKTDYFEVRYEDSERNRRFFYQLEGEGIRYEMVAFLKAIDTGKMAPYIEEDVTKAMIKVFEHFYRKKSIFQISQS